MRSLQKACNNNREHKSNQSSVCAVKNVNIYKIYFIRILTMNYRVTVLGSLFCRQNTIFPFKKIVKFFST